MFPERLEEICNLASVPLPKKRIRRTRKARKKRIKTRKKLVKPEEVSFVEVEDKSEEKLGVAKPSTTIDDELKQSYERTQREQLFRKKKALEIAKQVKLLALDPVPEISNPVLNGLGKILPQIFRRCYNVSHSLTDILDADLKLSTAEEMKREAGLAEKRAGQLVENQKQEAEALKHQLEDVRERLVETEAERELWKKDSDLLERQVNLLLQTIRGCNSCLPKYTFAVLRDEKLSPHLLKNPMINLLIQKLTS